MYSFFGIPLNFDPLALTVALVAIYFVIKESRSNNNVIIKILECSSELRQNVLENKSFFNLKIVIQNTGLSLHDITLSLSYHGPQHSGRIYVSIPAKNKSSYSGEFAKGMIAEFEFKSYELKDFAPLTKTLNDIRLQDTTLNLYSQNYLAKSFRIGGLRDKIIIRWNRIAQKLRYQKKVGLSPEGCPVVKYYGFPVFYTLEDKLNLFLDSIKHGNPNDTSI